MGKVTTLFEQHHEWFHHGDCVRATPDVATEDLRVSKLLALLDEAVEEFYE
ncbi:hypothetical protein [Brachybacterium sp. UMB0905]|uniref:hypothetical protein n=1 Tax=Brachybacterium sp. UMB0905 TaxID=2069310 RepID=UPI001E5D90B8|nr:hypothetical protein [Brachybacterium sp. UMB0905]